MIEIKNIKMSYGDNNVLKDISLKVNPGMIHGYLGPNGAGKSTTIKLLLGLLKPDSGTVKIHGINPYKNPIEARKLVGFVPEELTIYEHLTPHEFLHVIGEIHEMSRDETQKRIDDLLDLFQLGHVIHQKMSSFSRGMKQKIMISSSVIHNPEVLLLDEPLSGMDVNAVLVFRDLIQDFSKQGKTIIYSSHIVEVVERVCDKVTILIDGQIKHNLEREEIEKNPGKLEKLFRKEAQEKSYFDLSQEIIERL